MKYDLGFGNSVCVRDAFLNTYRGNMIVFTGDSLSRMDYPARDGDPELIDLTREVIKRQTGMNYKYIILTNGATGGVVIALRGFKEDGFVMCHTRNAPWYLRYPSMIRAAGMEHVDEKETQEHLCSVLLADLPSNPLALLSIPDSLPYTPVIIDGVYLNKVYMNGFFTVSAHHAIMVGSYSKLLGLNGLRIGWAATNDQFLYERMRVLAIGEYCGLSVPSVDIIKTMLFNFDWDGFERGAKCYLDYNREKFSKIEKFFGGKSVSDMGMFYYAPIDGACKKLLEKSGVTYTPGSQLGTTDDFGRFNLGQGLFTINSAVDAILKADSTD
jgi:aspartate/methionine/tyrosine aminotransferase